MPSPVGGWRAAQGLRRVGRSASSRQPVYGHWRPRCGPPRGACRRVPAVPVRVAARAGSTLLYCQTRRGVLPQALRLREGRGGERKSLEKGPYFSQSDGPSASTYSGAAGYMQQGMPRKQQAAPATQHAPAARAEPDDAARATADTTLMSLAFIETSMLS